MIFYHLFLFYILSMSLSLQVAMAQRVAAASVAILALSLGVLGLLWCFLSPPPFSVEVDGPPSYHRNDPERSIYLGNGCFWHTQYDFVVLEQNVSGPFKRNDSSVTSLVGFAGGRFESPSGAVCYHGLPGTDYSRMGHAEACSVQLDEITGPIAQQQAMRHGFHMISLNSFTYHISLIL